MDPLVDLDIILLNQEKLLVIAEDIVTVIVISIGLMVGLFCLNFFFRVVFND